LVPQKLQQISPAKTAPLVEEVAKQMVPVAVVTQFAEIALSNLII